MGKRALFRNIVDTNTKNSQFWVGKTGICVRSATSESKSTLIMPASHGDISVDLQGSLTGMRKKEHACFCRSTTWWSYRARLFFCNLSKCCRFVHFFQWNESEHVVLPIVIIWHCVRWISGALNEHYLKFWALNRALNAEKTRDAQSAKSKFYEPLSHQPCISAVQ